MVVLLFGSILHVQISKYLNKRNESASIVQGYEKSRGGLIDAMLRNISSTPLQGIGFGIASNPDEMVVQRDPVLGLPTGAVIEKGVLPIAVLEEIGLFGFVLFAVWVVMVIQRSARAGFAQFAVCMTALLLNLGECTLFSPGGMGLLSLILFGWCVNRSGAGETEGMRSP